MSPPPPPDAARWAQHLDRWADRPALILADGSTTRYAALLKHADAIAAQLGPIPRFVALLARNDSATIAALLGCYRAGHPILLLDADGTNAPILQAFAPEAIIEGTGIRLTSAPPPTLHPDLALLLPTSGSTGAPKLVRLSSSALAANAEAIIQYLGITASDRAMLTLPIHYSFGLSVLHSHLMAGAALVVNDLSVTHPDFEPLLARSGATSLAGVPYTYQLLESAGLLGRLPASLVTLTQAGGRLPPDQVRALATMMAARGGRFFAMYGQTEAAPRMAWLPPEHAIHHPDCIGCPVPGGQFHLIDENGQTIDTPNSPGELVYRGPNVMMGYALAREDLARGPELTELCTGDIAERTPEGLYRIVGRASRFAKIAGLRIGFDELEAQLAAAGHNTLVTGDDSLITIHAESTPDPDALRAEAAARAHLPERAIAVVTGPVPRLASGKPDYPAIRRAGASAAAARAAALGQSAAARPILAAFRQTFARDLDASHSFQSLGGDSLSYVAIVMALEAQLGRLPPGWEAMPIATLEAMALDAPSVPAPAPHTRHIATETLLRLWALLLVLIGHAAPERTEALRGGATILFMMAGYNLARFQRPALEAGRGRAALSGSLERMVLPYLAVMVPMLLLSSAQMSWSWFALVSVFVVDDRARGPLFPFWFIETVLHALLLTLLVFRVPALRRLSAARPFAFALLLLGLALALKLLVPAFLFRNTNPIILTLDGQYWLYALGWAAAVVTRRWQAVLLMALALSISLLDLGTGSSRPYWLAGGLLLLLAVPSLPVPAALAPALLRAAASGYFIYVAHALVHHLLKFELRLADGSPGFILLYLAASIAAGLAFARAWALVWSRLRPLAGPSLQG